MRPLSRIAHAAISNLRATYTDAHRPPAFYFHAMPYLMAMRDLRSCADNYALDSGHSVVAYALSNLGPWRGDFARAIKAELLEHLDAFKKLGPEYLSLQTPLAKASASVASAQPERFTSPAVEDPEVGGSRS